MMAIWVLDYLRSNDEILLPVDYQCKKGPGHNTLLYIKKIPNSDMFDMHYIETYFQAQSGIKREAVRNKQWLGIPDKSRLNRGQFFTPGDFASAERAKPGDPKQRIFAVRSSLYKFESLSDSAYLDKDANAIGYLLGIEFFESCEHIKATNNLIQQHLNTLGEWETPPQRMVRVQNPFACELSSILAFSAYLFKDEVAFQVLQKALNLHALELERAHPNKENADLIKIRQLKSEARLQEALETEGKLFA